MTNEISNPDPNMITFTANGQPRTIQANSTIADFLQQLNIEPGRVVAQLNGGIVPRNEFDQAVLQAGYKLELVTMVGGG
jgi:sulfur carrier protein